MIGVVVKHNKRTITEEFFQLFKVPWEFFKTGRKYDVLIITTAVEGELSAKLKIIFETHEMLPDQLPGARAESWLSIRSIDHTLNIPIYCGVSTLACSGETILWGKGGEPVGFYCEDGDEKTVHVGYDLFDEVEFLLTQGQPAEYALIPTLEVHMALLRRWILQCGIPLVEIPPIPHGYDFMVCLTHDVDFLGIRHYGLGRTMLGFLSRIFSPGAYSQIDSGISWRRLGRNLRALISLPLVYMGLISDFWDNLERYLLIEKDKGSTFYFIPYPEQAGNREPSNGTPPPWRAARYDIRKYAEQLKEIAGSGQEVGLHGIDAWDKAEKGLSEKAIIEELTGTDCLGVRMHWLYFDRESPKVIESIGLKYDSTVGYNEAVGFRTGTGQVYKLPGTVELMELPMIIQDSAMFYGGRLNLGEIQAFSMCDHLVGEIKKFGGVLTINWHQRSLSPERNWDSFYLRLLERLESYTPWFATASEAVQWFKSRRSVRFQEVSLNSGRIRIQSVPGCAAKLPHMTLRVYLPDNNVPENDRDGLDEIKWTDIEFHTGSEMEIPVYTD